ncbi:MAG: hypothetical protein IKW70_02410, partial [Verrucomicrobia bacterium]|nr:hypothetical protein [Verrucomicrobiota bacterium]
KNEIAQHWDLLLDKQQPLWLQLYNYLEKSDDEINTLWEELKEAYQSQLVQDSSQIVSIYSSVLDMIANKCCPDTDMTNDKAFELALTYISNYNSEPPHKVLKYTSRLFDNCETYGHHQRTSAFFRKFQRDFFSLLIYFEQQYIIPENYNTFLNKLDLDEETFDKYWYNGKMKYQSFFEYQPSQVLINKLLSLHPRKFKERLYTIQEYFFDSPTPNYTLLQFEKEMVSNFKKELLDKDKVIDHSKRYWIERVLPEFEEDIHKKEAELSKIHNQNILTDKEPDQ